MTYRILADENIDQRVVARLRADGHAVEHVPDVPRLGQGTPDADLASYSLSTNRLLLTKDDDFLREFGSGSVAGLLFIPDESLSYRTIGAAVEAIADAMPQSEVETVYVTEAWVNSG